MAPIVLIVTLLFASSAGARVPVPMVGTWVSAEARQALEAGEQRALGCILTIDERPLEVREACDGVERAWPKVRFSSLGQAGLQIRSEDPEDAAGVVRTIVSRAGAPDELEVRVEVPGGAREFRRLYRLDAGRLAALETAQIVQGRLVGQWKTDDGGALAFGPDGTFSFQGEQGRFQVEAGFETAAGAWGALTLQPQEGQVRQYLLHGAGWRVGLAEVPRDLELRLPSDVPAPVEVAEAVEEAESVEVDGVAIPLPPRAPSHWAVVAPWEEEPQVTLWLTRQAPEQMAAAERAEAKAEATGEPGAEVDGEVAEEPPPIAQPIVPARRRACGCGAGEAGLLALVAVPLWRRKRCT